MLGPLCYLMNVLSRTTSSALISILFCSCGIEQEPSYTSNTPLPHQQAIASVEARAAERLGLSSPVDLVEFQVDTALQRGQFVDSTGLTLSFCWDGRWSMSAKQPPEGFYLGPCPPTQADLDLEDERAIVILASASVRRSLPCSDIQRIRDFHFEHGHGYPYSELGPEAWATRLLWLSRVPKYSIAARMMECGD